MKFDTMYPNAKKEDEVIYDESCLFYGEAGRCNECEELTNWINISFMWHLCSTECEEATWAAFREACKGVNDDSI